MTRRNVLISTILVGALAALLGTLAGVALMQQRQAAEAAASPQPGEVEVIDPSPGEPGYEPVTRDAAKAAAQREFDRYAVGDWGGAWDLWTAAGKAAISRSDYHDFHVRCGTMTGLRFSVVDVSLTGNKAGIAAERGGLLFHETMAHEDGHWRYEPKPEALADYKLGVERMLQKGKAEGKCD